MVTFVPKRTSYSDKKWRQLYEEAILKSNAAKLADRICEARHEILQREAEISALSEEYSALSAALKTLRILEEVTTKTTHNV